MKETFRDFHMNFDYILSCNVKYVWKYGYLYRRIEVHMI